MNRQLGASAYTNTQNQTALVDATPHRQIALLFASAMDRIHRARGAIENGDMEQKGILIGKVLDIVMSLDGWLDLERGGDVASNLRALYDYIVRCLHEANSNNNIDKLEEVARLLGEVKSGWDAIGAEVDGE